MPDEFEAPNPTEPTRIQEIKANIKAGEEWLKTGNYSKSGHREEFWKRNKAYLRCDWSDKLLIKDDSDFHVNIPYSNHRTIGPNLIFHDPYVNVEAKQPEFERDPASGEKLMGEDGLPVMKSDNFAAAKLMEIRLNHEIQQCRVKDVMKRCVGHAKGHYGIGWAKTGYQTRTVSQFNNDRDNKTNYWVDWCDSRDILFDWRATEARRMRWVAQRLILPKKDVLDLGFKIPPDHVSRLPEHILERNKNDGRGYNSGSMDDKPGEFVEFFEYEDLDQKTVDWVLLDGPGEDWFYMADTSVEPHPFEGSSFVPLVIDQDDDDLIGITDIQPIEDHVRALNRMRTREVYHMDNYGTGVIAEESAVTKDQKKAYEKTPYGFWLKVKDGFLNKIKIQGTPSMGADHYNTSETFKEEIRTQLGITDYQQGGANIQRKATEASIIRSDSAVRIEDARATVGEFGIEIARRLMAMIQEFDTETNFYNVAKDEFDDDFVEVLKKQYGYNPKLPFLGISRDQIQGEFDLKLNIEDLIMQPKEVRAAQLQRSLQVVGSSEMLLEKFVEEHDIGKVISDLFELNGVNLKKYKKGGPVQLSAMVENEMLRKGLEVPEPHRKDNDDEHVLAHGPLRRELEQAIMALQMKLQKIQGGMQMIPEMMAGDPSSQTVFKTAQGQVEMLTQQLEQIQQILRRTKLHMQAHVQQASRKSGEVTTNQIGMGQATGIPPTMEDVNMPVRIPGGF